MKIFDRYILKNLFISTVFISITLAVVIFLTQSIRFLELVIEAGAAGQTFWTLTALALPRFFEVILPLSLMIAVIFTYHRMNADSELVVIRAVGHSPLALARPALVLAGFVTIALWFVTLWLAPASLAGMQAKRQEIKAQFSSLVFRDGIFNQVGKGLTVYARERGEDGTLLGLMIHDNREGRQIPSTILAKRGIITPSEAGYKVLVFDGRRLEYDAAKGSHSRLNFERYMIDLPDSSPVTSRWQQPDERTIFELLNPDVANARDRESRRDFRIEIHRRIISPLLALSLTIVSCAALLIGPVDRRGQLKRIVAAAAGAIIIQGLYIAAYNLARQHDGGLLMMYLLTLTPIGAGLFLLSGHADTLRRTLLYNPRRAQGAPP